MTRGYYVPGKSGLTSLGKTELPGGPVTVLNGQVLAVQLRIEIDGDGDVSTSVPHWALKDEGGATLREFTNPDLGVPHETDAQP